MFNPPRPPLDPKKENLQNPYHQSAMTHKPHLPPPASPSRSPSPDPTKAPSCSPVSVSEFLGLGSGGGGSDAVGKEAGSENRGTGGGMRTGRLEDRSMDSSNLDESVSDIGTLSPVESVRERSIHQQERTHAIRATLDSLWGSSGRKGGFDPIVVDAEGDYLEELDLEEGEEQLKREREERLEKKRGGEMGKQRKTEREGGEVMTSMPKFESIGASSLRDSEQALRSQGRHHCLLDGHLFREHGSEAIGKQERTHKTKNKIEEKTVKCCRCSERIAEEDSWVCEVEVCGIVACRGCVKRWEKERKKRIIAGQKGVVEWLGS